MGGGTEMGMDGTDTWGDDGLTDNTQPDDLSLDTPPDEPADFDFK